MKQVKRFLIVVFMLLGCVAIQAADDLKTIELKEAGTLSSQINSTEKYNITNLKIKGEINGTDLRMIRDMAGCDYQGKSTDGKLATLDLSDATIVSGGEYYYSYNTSINNYTYSTKENELGWYAFKGCSSLVSVVIPSGVTSIGRYAFEACSSLVSVVIPSGVTSIASNAFYGCSSLKSIEIPSSVTSIASYAFYGCSSLTSVEIPSSVTSICAWAFYNCSSLASIEIPSSVTSIASNAFYGCSSLKSIEIPSSVTSIGESAFRGCSSLTSVVIPSSVTKIDRCVFYGCSSLASVVIPSGVKSIGDYAFENCSSLTSIEIPSRVTSIGEQAFYGCSSLTSIEIPSCVTSIGSMAFYNCGSLTSVYVSREKTVTINSNVFSNVDKKKCTLYVPKGTSQTYSKATGWKDFTNIVENYYRIGDTPYSFDKDLGVDNLTLEDGKDFVANVPFKATNASYSRTMTSNWGTLCLPFAVETTSTDSKFYKIEDVNSNVITLSQLDGTIAAGTPVLVYSTNETNETKVLNISASNVDVVTTPAEGAASGWQLVGSFAETEVPNEGYIISKNKFWLTSDLTKYSSVVKAVKTKGLRAYLKSGSDSSEAKAHVLGFAIDDEDKTTAIDAIDGLTEGTAEIYDIQGRRTDRLQKGLNIVKMGSVTKKVMVK